MGFLSVLSCAHQWIASRLVPGDLAIDATVGTGADTLFLAQQVGRRGQVIGFDIQSEALTLAQARIRKQKMKPSLAPSPCFNSAMIEWQKRCLSHGLVRLVQLCSTWGTCLQKVQISPSSPRQTAQSPHSRPHSLYYVLAASLRLSSTLVMTEGHRKQKLYWTGPLPCRWNRHRL